MIGPEHDASRSSPAPDPPPSLGAALQERVRAEGARIATVGEIALAEGRQAGVSAVALAATVLVAALLLIVMWLLLMTLLAIGLVALGLSPAWAVTGLLLAHVLAAAALGLFARRMLRNLRFDATRSALGRTPPDAAGAEAPTPR